MCPTFFAFNGKPLRGLGGVCLLLHPKGFQNPWGVKKIRKKLALAVKRFLLKPTKEKDSRSHEGIRAAATTSVLQSC